MDLSEWDRSRALETAWSNGWQTATKTSALKDLWFSDLQRDDVPKLILMTTSVQDGEPMAISHLCNFGVRTLHDVKPGDIPLTTASIISARFPFISSTAHVPDGAGASDFVEGGYFENSELTAAIRLIRTLRGGQQDPAAAESSSCGPFKPAVTVHDDPRLANASIIVVRIRNGASKEDRHRQAPFFGLSSQLSALYATGDARAAEATQTLDQLEGNSPAECANRPGCLLVKQVTFSLSPTEIPLPLGWQLSSKARDEIIRQLGLPCNQEAFTFVKNAIDNVSGSLSC
ncbi:hypothetical protein ACVIGA_000618 [Bradyrhizobium sp. USDA 3240]